MTTIDIKDKEFSPNPEQYKTAKHISIQAINDTVKANLIKGYIYHCNEDLMVYNKSGEYNITRVNTKKYMLLNKPAMKLLPDHALDVLDIISSQGELMLPDEFGKPGIPAAVICRNDITAGKYIENTEYYGHYTFGQYVTYNKNKSFVCAEGKRYYRLFEHNGECIVIIVANYKQGLPTEVSAYAINGDENTIPRVFHQLYDDYGYPKTLTITYSGVGIRGTVIESYSIDKTKFFGVYSRYNQGRIIEWSMLDGNNNSYDGLRILGNDTNNTIKISYYIKGKKVTSQQYVDYIRNISFKGVLGDSKQPQITALIMEYSNLSHIKNDLVDAKKVLTLYNTQQPVIEALQVIDTVIDLLS